MFFSGSRDVDTYSESMAAIVTEGSNHGSGQQFVHDYNAKEAFCKLNQLRRNGIMCDLVLEAEGLVIPVHKLVLVSVSPYFMAMFTSKMSEHLADKVKLKDISGNALKDLVEYIYTSQIEVTEDNVQYLLPAANLLELSFVRDSCCKFLRSQLHPSNCLGIRQFADIHACSDLLTEANNYTEKHFVDVINGEEFQNLSYEQVRDLISSDSLVVSSEDKVFEAVINWVQHDADERDNLMPDLLEHVRLPLLSKDFLVERVEQEPLVKKNSLCKDFLIEALKYHLMSSNQRALMTTKRTQPRVPAGLCKVMYVVGGQAPKAIKSVECFGFKEERWQQVTEMTTRRCRAGVVVLDNEIWAIGGFNGSLRVRTVDKYNPVHDRWESGPPMEARRSTLGAAVLDGKLYAVGGFDGSTGLNSVEVYCPATNEWKMTSPMNTRRSSVGVGVVNKILYVVGGYDGISRSCLSSVEKFDTDKTEWAFVAEMSTRRSGAGVGVINELLYAVGGHDGPLVKRSAECYNPVLNEWRAIADMNMCRRNAGVAAVNGLLYVVGGDDGSANLVTVEYYNPKTDTWTLLDSTMSTGRSYAGVTVIDKLLN